jgi:hypothetical protein
MARQGTAFPVVGVTRQGRPGPGNASHGCSQQMEQDDAARHDGPLERAVHRPDRRGIGLRVGSGTERTLSR